MFRRSLAVDEGLLLVQKRENRSESAIHMLFMFIDLTVVWIKKEGYILIAASVVWMAWNRSSWCAGSAARTSCRPFG